MLSSNENTTPETMLTRATVGGAIGHGAGLGLFYLLTRAPITEATGYLALFGLLNVGISSVFGTHFHETTNNPYRKILVAARVPYSTGAMMTFVMGLSAFAFKKELLTLLCLGFAIETLTVGTGVTTGLLAESIFKWMAEQYKISKTSTGESSELTNLTTAAQPKGYGTF